MLTAVEVEFANRTPKQPRKYLRAGTVQNQGIGVDRENGVIRGYICAEAGDFKTKGRGTFNEDSLKAIQALMATAPEGLPSRMQHPSIIDDGLFKILGRLQNPRLSTVNSGGKSVMAVRADLHLTPAALDTPVGGGKPIGVYLMDLLDDDPGLVSSSLVLEADQQMQVDQRGKLKLGSDGEPLPPLWMPTMLVGSDVVGRGEAVGSLLSADGSRRHTSAADAQAIVAQLSGRLSSEAIVSRNEELYRQWDAEDAIADHASRIEEIKNAASLRRRELLGNGFSQVVGDIARLEANSSAGRIEKAEFALQSALCTLAQIPNLRRLGIW